MTTTSTQRSEFDEAAARNVAAAREGLAVDAPHSRQVNHHLVDLVMFDKQIKRGELATFAGELRGALSLGGLQQIAYTTESVDEVRAALRAYGQWLIQVADLAR